MCFSAVLAVCWKCKPSTLLVMQSGAEAAAGEADEEGEEEDAEGDDIK